MAPSVPPEPTERELQILKVLWEQGEASVRQVYEALRDELPIVQNTVQAFLRTMEAKGLVRVKLLDAPDPGSSCTALAGQLICSSGSALLSSTTTQ